MSEKETKKVAKAETKAKANSKLADKLFKEISGIDGVKDKEVTNGVGLWVGSTRVCKRAKSGFGEDVLLFPRDPIKAMVKEKKLSGTITPKNVAAIPVTAQNYGALIKGVKAAVSNAISVQAEKAKKKKKDEKKAVATKKAVVKATKKSNRAAAAAKVKQPTPQPEAAAASSLHEMAVE